MKKIFYLFCLSLLLIGIVSAAAPHIVATLLNQDPDPVEQGDVVELRFKIENDGEETSESVEAEILPKYPFSLYSGEAIKKIGKLRAGQTGADAVIVDYKLRVDEKAVEGDNEIEFIVRAGTLEFSYTDNEFMVDINDYTTPDIRAYIKENTVLEKNSRGTITLEIANVDITDVKFLQLILLPSEDYQLLSSSNYVYIGDIDSDDTDSEDFEIFVKSPKDGGVSFPIRLEYQDSNENSYEKELHLKFNVYSSSELSKYGLKEANYWSIIIFLVILAIIIYFYRKKRRK